MSLALCHRKRSASLLLTLCLGLALAAIPLFSRHAGAATDLVITGGVGGTVNGIAGVYSGNGGQGGYVKDDAFWGAGGGGGGAGDVGNNQRGLPGNNGSLSAGGSGGVGGASPTAGNLGGDGGEGNKIGGLLVPGVTATAVAGGGGGGYANEAYTNGTFTAEGGEGGTASTGGNGGAAGVTLSAPIAPYDTVTVTSGANGANVGGYLGGAGGAASLTANTLIAPTINLTKNDGALTFNVTTLDVTTGSTSLSLNGTTAWSGGTGVNIGTVLLDSNNTFTVTSANSGAGAFNTLNVTGSGGTLAGGYSPAFATVNLAGGSTLTSTANPLNFNTLNVRGAGATYVGDLVANGKTLNFFLSPVLTAGDTLLTVNGNADIAGGKVGLDTSSGRPNINPGDKLILLDVQGGTLSGAPVTLTVKTASGDTYTVEVDGDQLEAILQSLSPTTPSYQRLKAYAESRAANLALVNQGVDFLLNKGFGSALAATSGPGFKFNAFGGLGGGWSSYHTGSHVDVSGLSLLAGIALGNDVGPGRATLGAFFEAGWGSYNSYNSFSSSASVDGKGNMDYYGGGILARYDLTQGFLSGLYFDASGRIGGTRTDFRSDDIQYNGWHSNFESYAMYYGLHGGLGYIWKIPGLDDKGSLDLSAKLLWTRQQGDSLTVYQDHLRFKDADSLRTRLGGRFTYTVNDYIAPYIGAYWEHEFDGKARSEVNGQSLSSPSLRGDTGMGELGLSLKPSKDLPLSFDLGIQGYVGKREGVSGSLQAKWEF